MTARGDQKALIEGLLRKHGPAIRKAFLDAIQDAADSIVLKDVINALTRGDLEAAATAAGIRPAFLAGLGPAIGAAYYDGGAAQVALLNEALRRGGVTVEVRFDPGNPRAAGWVREHSSNLITEIVEEQRVTVREAMGVGLDAGLNPRTVALDVAGRIDKATGHRKGGIVGLRSGQEQSLGLAKEELADPLRMESYLERKLRDRRFDSIVRTAMRQGRPVPAVDRARIAQRYADRMRLARGEVIARTETLTALSYSQNESMVQLLEAGGIRRGQVKKRWTARLDGRTRDSHIVLNGTEKDLDDVFTSPSTGAKLRFPRDYSLGASGEDCINCRCYQTFSMDLSKGSRIV